MTQNKDLKRIVRARMRKTGESYTAARHRILQRMAASGGSTDLATRAGMSDAAVRAATGGDWSHWVRTLDAIGARFMPHRDIARHVRDVCGLGAWWSQSVTVGYERIRGLREIGQRRGGAFEVNKSRTYAVPLRRLYRAFGPRSRLRWLPGAGGKPRHAVREKSMRLDWPQGGVVEFRFAAKGERKSQVVVQHRGLSGRGEAARTRAFWGERLDDLGRLFD